MRPTAIVAPLVFAAGLFSYCGALEVAGKGSEPTEGIGLPRARNMPSREAAAER